MFSDLYGITYRAYYSTLIHSGPIDCGQFCLLTTSSLKTGSRIFSLP